MRTSRRKFLSNAGALGLAGTIPGGFYNLHDWRLPTQRRKSRKIGPSDTIRVGVIGTGGRGTNLMQNIQEVEGMEVVACCDILPFRLEKALTLAAKEAKGYDDYRRLLEHPSLDAVIISTPLYLHFEMAKDCLAAGKHIYCEKTMTFTIEEAKRLGPLVAESDSIFQVGYQHRYNTLYQKVKDIIRGEEFGPLSHVECYWNRNGDWRRPVPDPKFERIINWRMYREYSGGMMAELSSHQMNIVNWMVGASPNKVIGSGGIDYWKDGRETYDNIHAIFSYPDGLKVSCTCLTTNSQMGFQMKFYGKNATIQIIREDSYLARLWVEPRYLASMQIEDNKDVDSVTGATAMLKKGKAIPLFDAATGKEDTEPTIFAVADFGRCIREDRKPIVGYESGKESSYCVALANKAMQSGEPVYWKDYV